MKYDTVISFANERRNNPNLKKYQICKKLGFSASTLDRTMNDFEIYTSLYRYNTKKPKKKNNTKDTTQIPGDEFWGIYALVHVLRRRIRITNILL